MSDSFEAYPFSRAEQVMGLLWLGVGAWLSLLIEVVYLGIRLPVGEGRTIAFPVTIAVAFWFNAVLTRTARTWSPHPGVMLIPVAVWLGGFLVFLLLGEAGPVQMLGANLRTIGLLLVGGAGGGWPFFTQKWHTEPVNTGLTASLRDGRD